MAGLAAALRHVAADLAPVRVLVAVGAAGGGEVERDRTRRARAPARPGRWHCVAGHREVGAGEGVGGLRVVLGAEAGGAEAVHVVAALAAAPVGAPGELARVGVGVAVGAAVVLDAHRPARARGTSRSSTAGVAARSAGTPSSSWSKPAVTTEPRQPAVVWQLEQAVPEAALWVSSWQLAQSFPATAWKTR